MRWLSVPDKGEFCSRILHVNLEHVWCIVEGTDGETGAPYLQVFPASGDWQRIDDPEGIAVVLAAVRGQKRLEVLS